MSHSLLYDMSTRPDSVSNFSHGLATPSTSAPEDSSEGTHINRVRDGSRPIRSARTRAATHPTMLDLSGADSAFGSPTVGVV